MDPTLSSALVALIILGGIMLWVYLVANYRWAGILTLFVILALGFVLIWANVYSSMTGVK